MNFIPYAIRRPFYYVWSLIVSSDFRREEYGRIFTPYEYEQHMQILGLVNYLGMTKQVEVSIIFGMLANAETLGDAVDIWEEYKAQNVINASAQ